MTNQPAGWEGLLEDGETILWQGQPATGVIWRDLISLETVIGAFFTVFSGGWVIGTGVMVGSFGAADPFAYLFLLFPLAGTLFLAIGLYLLVGRLFMDSYQRGKTWYTLTNRAAFIATETFGRRRLQRCGIEQMRGFDLVDQHPGTIWFGYSAIRSSNGNGRVVATRTGRLGFRQIPNPREVWTLMAPHRREAEE
ncbi:hypothetical protein [Pararhodobacter sp. CCB-MM2]|uniref:hypothetical protein n=1 Tax=Pararhodobacter sp. CCB-MM2 TaxID=1786003 RepID=UPI00082F9C29|nr:hypothetical protein [Pararhodobacter sp. CCB-MM2]MCA2013863.1 hypothetical protein [Cereibacter sphaeroides]